MAGVRDPAFWKRFSVAVHLDEEQQNVQRPDLKRSELSWLARQERKRSRRTCICWIFWLSFCGVAAAVVIVIAWLINSGALSKVKIGNGDASPPSG